MYCKYVYVAGVSTAQIAADLAALVTGETNLGHLSAACDTSHSELVTTVAAGWTIHDAAPGGDYKVVKAPWADGLGYKYVNLGCSSTHVFTKGYENWNASTHTGFHLITLSDTSTYAQQLNLSTGGRLYLFVNARSLFILSILANGTVGGSTFPGPSGLLEHTRQLPWDTAANGIGPWGWTNLSWTGAAQGALVKVRGKKASTGEMAASIRCGTDIPGGATVLQGNSQTFPDFHIDGSHNLQITMYPILLTGLDWNAIDEGGVSGYYGEISSLCDIWMIQGGRLSLEDTFTYSGKTYIAMMASFSVCWVGRKA